MLKPAEITPLTALLFAEAAHDAGVGDAVVLGYTPDSDPGFQYYFADFQRRTPLVLLADADGDGWRANVDCDDTDASATSLATRLSTLYVPHPTRRQGLATMIGSSGWWIWSGPGCAVSYPVHRTWVDRRSQLTPHPPATRSQTHATAAVVRCCLRSPV